MPTETDPELVPKQDDRKRPPKTTHNSAALQGGGGGWWPQYTCFASPPISSPGAVHVGTRWLLPLN